MTLKEYIEKEKYMNENICPEDIEDINKIIKTMKTIDVEITPKEACEIWGEYSDDYCASWLVLPNEDDEIIKIIIEYGKRLYSDEEE